MNELKPGDILPKENNFLKVGDILPDEEQLGKSIASVTAQFPQEVPTTVGNIIGSKLGQSASIATGGLASPQFAKKTLKFALDMAGIPEALSSYAREIEGSTGEIKPIGQRILPATKAVGKIMLNVAPMFVPGLQELKIPEMALKLGTATSAAEFGKQIMDGHDIETAGKTALMAGVATGLTGAALRGVPLMGRKIAALEALGKNDNAAKYIEQNPQTVFGVKDKWQDVYHSVYQNYMQIKQEAGKAVSTLQAEAEKQGIDLSVDKNTILSHLAIIQKQPIFADNPEIINLFGNIANRVNMNADRTGRLGLKELENTMDSVTGMPGMQKVFKSVRDSFGKPNELEKAVLDARGILAGTREGLLNKVGDIGQAAIDAKARYSKLLKIDKNVMGGLTPQNTPDRLMDALKINNEDMFDAFHETLDPELFAKAMSIMHSTSKRTFERIVGNVFTHYGILRATGEFVASSLSKAGAVGAKVPNWLAVGLAKGATIPIRKGSEDVIDQSSYSY